MFAVTLHNIPEGMAVGLAFALAAQGETAAALSSAAALAIGMGIQNFPEGAGDIAAPAPGGPLGRQGFFIWEHFGRG